MGGFHTEYTGAGGLVEAGQIHGKDGRSIAGQADELRAGGDAGGLCK